MFLADEGRLSHLGTDKLNGLEYGQTGGKEHFMMVVYRKGECISLYVMAWKLVKEK